MLLNVKKMKKYITVLAVIAVAAIASIGTSVSALAADNSKAIKIFSSSENIKLLSGEELEILKAKIERGEITPIPVKTISSAGQLTIQHGSNENIRQLSEEDLANFKAKIESGEIKPIPLTEVFKEEYLTNFAGGKLQIFQ